jgi:metallophosphoesterase superfamily enzyme
VGGGFLYLAAARCLVAADAHLGIESALDLGVPQWSRQLFVEGISAALETRPVDELILLGDAVDAATPEAIDALLCARSMMRRITWIWGNHERRVANRLRATGVRPRSFAMRAGWMLSHGDKPVGRSVRPRIIGHLHPSIAVGDAASPAPCIVATSRFIVAPALSPYSTGLDVLSAGGLAALRRHGIRDARLFAVCDGNVLPLGSMMRCAEQAGVDAGQRASDRAAFRKRA